MCTLESIVAGLKTLPPVRPARAAAFIHELRVVTPEQKCAALEKTFGCMTPEEADAFEQAINEECERIDARAW